METVSNAKISEYRTRPVERTKPGSGDSAKILHSHTIVVGGEEYTFLAKGHRKWAFKTDTISFDYNSKMLNGKTYNNIVKSSLVTYNKEGEEVIRGDRSYKKVLRQPK